MHPTFTDAALQRLRDDELHALFQTVTAQLAAAPLGSIERNRYAAALQRISAEIARRRSPAPAP